MPALISCNPSSGGRGPGGGRLAITVIGTGFNPSPPIGTAVDRVCVGLLATDGTICMVLGWATPDLNGNFAIIVAEPPATGPVPQAVTIGALGQLPPLAGSPQRASAQAPFTVTS